MVSSALFEPALGERQASKAGGLEVLRLLRTRFLFQARNKVAFLPQEEGYKGSALHGRFESALARVSPACYRLLCHPAQSAPKPYILLPPLDSLLEYPPGHQFACELTLIGAALRSYAACEQALQEAGAADSGTVSGQFTLQRVEVLHPTNPPRTVFPATDSLAPFTLALVRADEIMARHEKPAASLTLRFETPVRLQGASRRIPEFQTFTRSLLKRLMGLAAHEPGLSSMDEGTFHALFKLAKTVRIEHEQLRWYDWPRYSPTQGQWMRLGGYLGGITYTGEITPFLSYLTLGEWVHVGGKTSFGLGKYRMTLPQRAEHGDVDGHA